MSDGAYATARIPYRDGDDPMLLEPEARRIVERDWIVDPVKPWALRDEASLSANLRIAIFLYPTLGARKEALQHLQRATCRR